MIINDIGDNHHIACCTSDINHLLDR